MVNLKRINCQCIYCDSQYNVPVHTYKMYNIKWQNYRHSLKNNKFLTLNFFPFWLMFSTSTWLLLFIQLCASQHRYLNVLQHYFYGKFCLSADNSVDKTSEFGLAEVLNREFYFREGQWILKHDFFINWFIH